MKVKSFSLGLILIGLLACGLWQAPSTANSKTVSSAIQNPQKPYQGFPDFGQMISAGDFEAMKVKYAKSGQYLPGPFRLAQDFPKTKPTDVPDFFKIDFKDGNNWLDYINKARDYCFEGEHFRRQRRS